jgi:hypothetical protein
MRVSANFFDIFIFLLNQSCGAVRRFEAWQLTIRRGNIPPLMPRETAVALHLENEIKRLIATVRPKVITEERLNLQTESLRQETQEEELSRRG